MFELITVVDKDLDRRNTFYEVLTELNYRVTTLPSPKELVELLKRERPHCVILATDGFTDSLVSTLYELRQVDKQFKLIALISPQLLEGDIGRALTAYSRVTLLNAELDRPSLLRGILSVLKEREVERVVEPALFQGTILLVEDEPAIAKLLMLHLEARGYKVTGVQNGEEAILQMRVGRPKVVILDLFLPGMDGLLTLQRLKAIDPSATIIVASGLQDEKLTRQALALGAAAYLVKPFDLAKLEATILTNTSSKLKP